MAAQTQIEWADATFNPWIGCTKVGPGCDHCYAEARMDTRLKRVQWGAGNARQRTGAPYWQQPHRWNRDAFRACGNCGWRGAVDTLIDDTCPGCGTHEKLDPARERVFCASLADWLDNEVPIEWLVDLLDLIRRTPNLDWLLLTKRIGNFTARLHAAHTYAEAHGAADEFLMWLDWWNAGLEVPKNIWIGATVVNQLEADRDVRKLLAVPAAVRFLSVEPMLGAIRHAMHCALDTDGDGNCYVHRDGCPKIDWVICGGESGPKARPMHPEWAKALRDQCAAAGVPFFFKQWGEWEPVDYRDDDGVRLVKMESSGTETLLALSPTDERTYVNMRRVGKKAAGRLLDGIEHNAFPETAR